MKQLLSAFRLYCGPVVAGAGALLLGRWIVAVDRAWDGLVPLALTAIGLSLTYRAWKVHVAMAAALERTAHAHRELSVLFEQAREDSMTDPLTLLPNRRWLFAHLTRELARAQRLGNEVALVMIDLDELKIINDTCGHHAGDHALRQVAVALQRALRPYDLCARYGGDEFIVVLGECSLEMAETKRRELQERIGEIVIDRADGQRIPLAASAGVAVFPQGGVSCETLIADADKQMYRDKASRRECAGLGRSPVSRNLLGCTVVGTGDDTPQTRSPTAITDHSPQTTHLSRVDR